MHHYMDVLQPTYPFFCWAFALFLAFCFNHAVTASLGEKLCLHFRGFLYARFLEVSFDF